MMMMMMIVTGVGVFVFSGIPNPANLMTSIVYYFWIFLLKTST